VTKNINLINYIDLCSLSILSIIDRDECSYDGSFIVLDRSFREMFEFYMMSNMGSFHQFGKTNIIVSTCNPQCNWRREQRGSPVESGRYRVTENGESLIFDIEPLTKMLDYSWNKMSRTVNLKKKFIFIQRLNIDSVDLISMLEETLGVKYELTPYHYYLVNDANMEYLHLGDIPEYLYTDVGIELKKNNLK
jgi:hypothetical protein